ncbi:glycosyltransferase family 2 protein [Aliiroseovarius sp. YM-037]|uniref:glycosyltransferase family 2 protein n=1 Tax=Aliiroseovarius sp. YM-037 TaxID=3341728 RepID=UPI003A801140
MISVIIPANNEADLIGTCLRSILASEMVAGGPQPEILVIANGCTDNTAEVAESFADQAAAAGWVLKVRDIKQGSKLNALNVGDGTASCDIRAYVDADVVVGPKLMQGLVDVLSRPDAAYASGKVNITATNSWASRAYRRIYAQVPFMTDGVPGCGVFAVNAAGRARWGVFPDIISDDTYVRLQFTPEERHTAPAIYDWPIVEGFSNLVRVRRRQDIGVAEVAEKYPELLRNDDKPRFGLKRALGLALRDPVGFGVYTAVALAVRLKRPTSSEGWSRGR